jgi:hypothetical protein
MPPSDLSPFEFDLSKMTIGDTLTILRMLASMDKPMDFNHHIAMLEMLDRVTVGGIMHLPADVAVLVIKDFSDYYGSVFGPDKEDGDES